MRARPSQQTGISETFMGGDYAVRAASTQGGFLPGERQNFARSILGSYTCANGGRLHTGLTPNQPYYYTIWVTQDGVNYTNPP